MRQLVPLGRAHRAALLRSASDPAVGDATGRGDKGATAWVDGILGAASRDRRSGHRCSFAVLDADAACVGVVSVRFHEPHADVGELAYWIEAAQRGRGHATAASRQVDVDGRRGIAHQGGGQQRDPGASGGGEPKA